MCNLIRCGYWELIDYQLTDLWPNCGLYDLAHKLPLRHLGLTLWVSHESKRESKGRYQK